ncbi:hypothetical protein RvY_16272 [Ramazzottius varieornatus]|uniref:Uncharacterized protein n=1 Tax=Ramazzottius varieornatus TaxID=947166 RepID=A0A1D1VXY1_RAMVA|nr:hypothetical protein RvY_16272 [Ramazzottius varieornatus]
MKVPTNSNQRAATAIVMIVLDPNHENLTHVTADPDHKNGPYAPLGPAVNTKPVVQPNPVSGISDPMNVLADHGFLFAVVDKHTKTTVLLDRVVQL